MTEMRWYYVRSPSIEAADAQAGISRRDYVDQSSGGSEGERGGRCSTDGNVLIRVIIIVSSVSLHAVCDPDN